LTQFNANGNWYGSQGSAALRLEAVEFLLVNRGQKLEDVGSSINYEKLEEMATALRTFLGASTARSFGRSRRNRADFTGDGGNIQ